MTTGEIAKVWLITIKGGWIFSPKAFSRKEHLSLASAPSFLRNRAPVIMTGEFRSPKCAFLVLNAGVNYNVTQSRQEKESSKVIVDMYACFPFAIMH